MKNNKGFTLIELIAVITILGIVSLLAMPSVVNTVKYSGNKVHEEQLAELEESARNWYVRNIGQLEREKDHCVSINELIQTGYIDKKEVIDSQTGKSLTGYIMITYNSSNDGKEEYYEYEYSDTCDIDMTGFKLRLMNTTLNEQNWAKTDVNIAVINGSDNTGYRYCKSQTGKCEPVIDGQDKNGTIILDTEGETNYVCAYAIQKDGAPTNTQCMGPYKIDKQAPEVSINGDLTYKSSESNLDILTGLNIIDNLTPTDKIKITTSSLLSEGIVGDYVIKYTISDLAGNVTVKTRKISIILDDEEAPGITLNVVGEPFNNNKWANKDININVKTDDGVGSGIRSYTYCTTENSTCAPTTRVNATSGTITINKESKTNYVCAYATDNSGNESGTICVGPYKLDKTKPTATYSDLTVTQFDTIDLWSEIAITDNSDINSLSKTATGSVSNQIVGTYIVDYKIIDIAGNTTQFSRNIIVAPKMYTVDVNKIVNDDTNSSNMDKFTFSVYRSDTQETLNNQTDWSASVNDGTKISVIANPQPGYKLDTERYDLTITENTIIEPLWTIISYDIIYNLDGGSASNPTTYNINSNFTLNNPTKEGYNFLGWTGSNGHTANKDVKIDTGTTGKKEYTANWEKYNATDYGGIYLVSRRNNREWEGSLTGYYNVGDTNVVRGNWEVTVSEYCVHIKGTKSPPDYWTYQFYVYKANNTSELLSTGSAMVPGDSVTAAETTICW